IGSAGLRVVFRSQFEGGEPYAGDQITMVKWASLGELAQMPDAELLSPRILKDVAARMKLGVEHPLGLLNEWRLFFAYEILSPDCFFDFVVSFRRPARR